jgi:peptidoglycan/LPS O-acetylase OafA/YrhL
VAGGLLWPGVRGRARPGRGARVRQRNEGRPRARLHLMRLARVAVLLDICCVLAFVIIGRDSHTKGESLAGIASTSWPFLCGLGAGWAASRAWRRPLALRPAGLAVWLCTVALGMILRVVSGQGTAFAFILVALAFLGLFLLGWRLLAQLLARRPAVR